MRGAVRRLRHAHGGRPWPSRLPSAPAAAGASLGGPAAGGPTAGRSATAPTVTGPAADDGADGAASDPLPGLLATLRAVTTRYVCRMRGDGARPEQMLVRVKACVREAMAAEGWHDPEAVQALTAAVVGWSIAAYYDR